MPKLLWPEILSITQNIVKELLYTRHWTKFCAAHERDWDTVQVVPCPGVYAIWINRIWQCSHLLELQPPFTLNQTMPLPWLKLKTVHLLRFKILSMTIKDIQDFTHTYFSCSHPSTTILGFQASMPRILLLNAFLLLLMLILPGFILPPPPLRLICSRCSSGTTCSVKPYSMPLPPLPPSQAALRFLLLCIHAVSYAYCPLMIYITDIIS